MPYLIIVALFIILAFAEHNRPIYTRKISRGVHKLSLDANLPYKWFILTRRGFWAQLKEAVAFIRRETTRINSIADFWSLGNTRTQIAQAQGFPALARQLVQFRVCYDNQHKSEAVCREPIDQFRYIKILTWLRGLGE